MAPDKRSVIVLLHASGPKRQRLLHGVWLLDGRGRMASMACSGHLSVLTTWQKNKLRLGISKIDGGRRRADWRAKHWSPRGSCMTEHGTYTSRPVLFPGDFKARELGREGRGCETDWVGTRGKERKQRKRERERERERERGREGGYIYIYIYIYRQTQREKERERESVCFEFEWGFYALSKDIFRARTYSRITYPVRWGWLLDEWN